MFAFFGILFLFCAVCLTIGLFWSPFNYDGGEKAGLLLMIGAVVGLLGLIACVAIEDGKKTDRLMAACMADGKKEYECYSMLRDPSPKIAPVTVVIPIR